MQLATIVFCALVAAPVAPTRIVVTPLEPQGELPTLTIKALGDELGRTLSEGSATWHLVDERCDDAKCWRGLLRKEGATFAVRPQVELRDKTYTFRLQVVGAGGATVSEVRDTCDVCGQREALDRISTLGARVLARIDATAGVPPTFVVTSRPAGAAVSVDGVAVGTTPLEQPVSPGRRVVRLESHGHSAQERTIVAQPGVREKLEFELNPLRDRSRGLVGGGIAAVSAGVVALVTGATLTALHDTPYRGRCSGNDIDENGTCRFRYNTLGGGIAGLVVGAGLVTVGAILIARGRRKRLIGVAPAALLVRF